MIQFIILCLALLSFQSAQADTLYVGVGSAVRIPSGSREKIKAIGPHIFGLKDLGPLIEITGLKVGLASLFIGDRTLQIQVLDRQLGHDYQILSSTLKDMKGLSLFVDGKDLVIKGEVLRVSDLQTISQIVADNHIVFSLQARVIAPIRSRVQKFIREQVFPLDSRSLDVRFEPYLQVFVRDQKPTSKKNLAASLSSLGLKPGEDASLVELAPMVEVKIIVAEVKRKAKDLIGIKWPASYEAQLLPTSIDFQPASAMINTLESRGLAKVLASPTLLCRSGKSAQFLAGGEFPIKIVNFRVNDVIWKKYGVLLSIQPEVDLSGRMSIAIETEVSTIDRSEVVDGIPGMLTNRIQSHFDLSESRTIALSGLIKSEWGRSREGLPFLSRLPILGPLFSSQDFEQNRSELIMFVTPRVTDGIISDSKRPEGWTDEL